MEQPNIDADKNIMPQISVIPDFDVVRDGIQRIRHGVYQLIGRGGSENSGGGPMLDTELKDDGTH